mmetsp:Transcript_21746/g.55163  ORF Transcript_21746/g.55163 Transcript_21746/m.55163 type:complete len:579 (-) Transcript_21746:91-1827(-)
MGKNQHSKAPMHLTASEWAVEWGGKKDSHTARFQMMPFDSCALSFTPFEHPVCAPDGAVFDLVNIMPFLAKHKKHPLTGEPLVPKQLLKLHYHKNPDGKYHCPVLFKAFNEFTHIVALRPTGHVYSYDAIQQLCLKSNNMHDLLTEAPFTRADIITLFDPHDESRRRVDSFAHVREGLQVPRADDAAKLINVNANAATARVLQRVALSAGAGGAGKGARMAVAASSAPPVAEKTFAGRALDGPAPLSCSTMRPSTHHCAASFTSTRHTPVTTNTLAPATKIELEAARYARVRKLGKKAYVQLATSLGAINLELHADLVPKTVENFITLAKRGYYDGTVFHRLLKNFMVQGGDPTGTGKGGESAWGPKFADEFIAGKLSHSGRGILSMANSGPNTNASQFFVTFKSCTHLDGVHSIFGRMVGGGDVLSKIENLATDKDDRPKATFTLVAVTVFSNPFEEVDAAPTEVETGPKAAPAPTSMGAGDAPRPMAVRAGVGMYIPQAAFGPASAKGGVAPAGAKFSLSTGGRQSALSALRGAAEGLGEAGASGEADGLDEMKEQSAIKRAKLRSRSELSDFSAW